MAEIRSSTAIARPVDDVFAALVDLTNAQELTNAPEFDPYVRSVTKTTDGDIGVGTTFRFLERTPPFGRYACTTATDTAVESPRQIEMVARIGRSNHGSGLR